jgi:lysophospholipase L1-like esterase
MRALFFTLALFIVTAFVRPAKKITIFMAGDSTMSVKETVAFPETGWGMPFVHFWDSTVTVINKAKNGRSTKTFISEGLWKSIMDNAKAGDFIFIQFGHNDEAKEKLERYTTPAEFSTNLEKFVKESRLKGAIPVLFTPVSRRRFDSTGKVVYTHEIYSALTEKVARENNVTLIDMDTRSRELYQQFGPEDSKLLFLQLKPGEHPNYPDGKIDNTHFNELGARLIAQIALKEIRNALPELNARVVVAKKK